MKKQPKILVSVAAAAIVAATLVSMVVRHRSVQGTSAGSTVTADVMSQSITPPVASVAVIDEALKGSGIEVAKLDVQSVDGIVIVRGRTATKELADRAGTTIKGLGYSRVANLIQVAKVDDDVAIEREAERLLARNRSLDGCRFNVDSEKGVLTVSGVVQRDLQADAARTALASLHGVRQVRADFRKF